MLTSDSDDPTAVGFYSLLRYVPDPLRDEAVNVGLFLVDEGGSWARFDGEIPRGLIRNMRRWREVPALERWIEQTKNVYGAVGEPAIIPSSDRITRLTLEHWSREFGASLRVTEPQTAVGSSFETLWRDLFTRLVLRSATASASLPPVLMEGPQPHASASGERDKLSRALVRTMQGWENFDRSRVRLHELFSGRKARHHVDVAVLNGSVTAIAKALPLVYGSEQDHIAARALLIDAAFDLRAEVVKLAIHDDPPPDRVELLQESKSLLDDLPNTVLIGRKEFPGLQDRFAARFFPEHDAHGAVLGAGELSVRVSRATPGFQLVPPPGPSPTKRLGVKRDLVDTGVESRTLGHAKGRSGGSKGAGGSAAKQAPKPPGKSPKRGRSK